MDIALSPNIERLLRNKVAEGVYNSLNEAINITLGIALNGGCISDEQLAQLNADIQSGIDEAISGKLSNAFDFIDEISA